MMLDRAAFVLPSTLLLTALLLVGLFFFVRASVKDRTQQVQLLASQPEAMVLTELEAYLKQRAYRIIELKPEQAKVVFAGQVRPSLFLALFLTGLAAVGLGAVGMVLAILLPQWGWRLTGLATFAPLAGWFYWQKAGRQEQVILKVQPMHQTPQGGQRAGETALSPQTLVTVTAHRDELLALQASLPYPAIAETYD